MDSCYILSARSPTTKMSSQKKPIGPIPQLRPVQNSCFRTRCKIPSLKNKKKTRNSPARFSPPAEKLSLFQIFRDAILTLYSTSICIFFFRFLFSLILDSQDDYHVADNIAVIRNVSLNASEMKANFTLSHHHPPCSPPCIPFSLERKKKQNLICKSTQVVKPFMFKN